MLDAILAVFLSPGVKGLFEDPRWLLGAPLAGLGALGLLIALSPIELRWPQPSTTSEETILPPPEGHPGPSVYLTVGVILAVITLIEVAIYYVDMAEGLLLTFLLALSALKFVLVVLWFMHLRFDNQLFSVFFGGALALVAALFVVVLLSLSAGLV
jgi:cytochrome c oxidase subunit 4